MNDKYSKRLNAIEELLKILVVNSVSDLLKSEEIKHEQVAADGIQLKIENLRSIIDFFKAVDDLKNREVIRSNKYTGDIAEYIVSKLFEVKLCKSGREIGYDGTYIDTKKRVQIKFHDGEKRTNIPFSQHDKRVLKEKKVQDIIIMLGRDSNIKPLGVSNIPYLIYKIPITRLLKHDGGIGKGFLKKIEPVYKFSEMFEELN